MTTFTPNYGLNKPDFDQIPWHTEVNDNSDMLDGLIGGVVGAIPQSRGAWANSTAYILNDITLDAAGGTFWKCAVAHTSHASDSFTTDRTNNPTYWANYGFGLANGRRLVVKANLADFTDNTGTAYQDLFQTDMTYEITISRLSVAGNLDVRFFYEQSGAYTLATDTGYNDIRTTLENTPTVTAAKVVTGTYMRLNTAAMLGDDNWGGSLVKMTLDAPKTFGIDGTNITCGTWRMFTKVSIADGDIELVDGVYQFRRTAGSGNAGISGIQFIWSGTPTEGVLLIEELDGTV